MSNIENINVKGSKNNVKLNESLDKSLVYKP